MTAYYNENDPFAAQWLRNLIAEGLIADGHVDDRDIRDVRPSDLRGYRQAHFFAGIGGWSYALRLAGWPDDRPVWTGSCPCQPFSAAGKRQGTDDPRHLWPVWFPLIQQCRPAVVFGEQVDRAAALGWLDLVFDDLEREDYATGAAVAPAAGVGAPHRRDRLWFVAYSQEPGWPRRWPSDAGRHASQQPEGLGAAGKLANDIGARLEKLGEQQARGQREAVERDRAAGAMADRDRQRQPQWSEPDGQQDQPQQRAPRRLDAGGCGLTSFWSDCEWIECTDGKARPVESGSFPLAHGVPGRVGRLRAYGNSIVPQAAAAFIKATMRSADD